MDKLKKLKAAYQLKVDEMQKLLEDSDKNDWNDEQQEKFDSLSREAESIKQQISNLESILQFQAESRSMQEAVPPSQGRKITPDVNVEPNPVTKDVVNTDVSIKLPARAKRWAGRLRSFKGSDADIRAYRAGMWLAAVLCKSAYAKRFCLEHGISVERVELTGPEIDSLHQEGVNTAGGYLVFPEYENDIIRLVESFGLARQKLKIVPMVSDTKIKPRRTGGLTAYFIGEGDQITESDLTWDNVKLIVKKLGAITTASNELRSDAIIALADEVTTEIALAFATKEDICTFQGDGTSTYGGIVGLVQKLSTINGVDDGGGLVLGTGNLWSELTDADMTKVVGQVPNYAGLRPEWYCSKPFWAQVMVKLIRATGGATMAEMEGSPRMIYAGYPVNWTSGTTAMPVSQANSQIACLFGDLSMAAMFGDRQGIAIATSVDATVGDTSMFDTDSFAIRGIERFDINVHDVGSATAAGPVVGLITAAS